jgi:transcription elongation factor Elf1
MIAEPAIFTCSICGEPSTDICGYCTKDTCSNHRCTRCKRCSDCCECEVPLSAAEAPVGPDAVVEPDAVMETSPNSPVGPEAGLSGDAPVENADSHADEALETHDPPFDPEIPS